MSAFIDTNVVIYATDENSEFHDWATTQIATCQADGAAFICDIVYCELSMGYRTQLDLDRVIEMLALERRSHDDAALVGAGVAYWRIRTRKKVNLSQACFPTFSLDRALSRLTCR